MFAQVMVDPPDTAVGSHLLHHRTVLPLTTEEYLTLELFSPLKDKHMNGKGGGQDDGSVNGKNHKQVEKT